MVKDQEYVTYYDKDYFENGISTGKSMFVNYTWLPELTIPLAYRMIKIIKIKEHEKLLDFGSAKGYLVYAFRLLGFEAWGCDISPYAIQHSHENVKEYNILFDGKELSFDFIFDWIISKDVFEHIPYNHLDHTLNLLSLISKKLFIIIPLGENGKFIIPQYESDTTHIVRETASWWVNKFEQNSWEVEFWSYDMTGLKDNWKNFRKGNAFFTLKNRHFL